jgi:hypothetical protein
MLKITTVKEQKKIRFVVEGKLAFAWINVLERCWDEAKNLPHTPEIEIEFNDITFIDDHAKELLEQMASTGVKLIAKDIQMKAVVEAIQKSRR